MRYAIVLKKRGEYYENTEKINGIDSYGGVGGVVGGGGACAGEDVQRCAVEPLGVQGG